MSAWANYEEAKVGTFKILPPAFRYKELRVDYASMKSMIFDKYLELLIITLQKLLLQYYAKKYGTTIYHSVNMLKSYVIN